MAREVRALTKTPVEVIHWGVDTTRFCPEGARAYLPQRNERALPIVTVGSVKRLEPIYGVMDLTRAFLLARERLAGRIDLRLVLVGGGSQRGAVEEELEAAGQRGAAHMAGDVCYEEVPGWQRSLDVFCALSLEESYGVAVAEAKSCGRPVIVSDAPGFLELVTDGADGVVVRKRHPEAAAREIMRLALDPSLRSRLGGAGRRHVLLKLKWATTIRRTLDTYEGLLAGR